MTKDLVRVELSKGVFLVARKGSPISYVIEVDGRVTNDVDRADAQVLMAMFERATKSPWSAEAERQASDLAGAGR
jgi:hypothetical protein